MAHALVWFKRDLRIADHAPLLAAAASGRAVLPVYIVEPVLWQQDDASARQWAVVRESLQELRAELAAIGAPLQVLRGDVVEAFAALHRAHGLAEVHAHEETGSGWTFARDRRVGAWLRDAGIPFVEHPNGSTVRRLRSRDGWARHWERHNGDDPLPAPGALHPARTPHPSASATRRVTISTSSSKVVAMAAAPSAISPSTGA